MFVTSAKFKFFVFYLFSQLEFLVLRSLKIQFLQYCSMFVVLLTLGRKQLSGMAVTKFLTEHPSESVLQEGLYHPPGLPKGSTFLIYFAAMWI
jgi:hypothetical protein